MTSQEFCYWLQGMFELSDPSQLDSKQTDLIKRHLNMVFIHEIDQTYPSIQQAALDAAHKGEPEKKSPFFDRPPGARC